MVTVPWWFLEISGAKDNGLADWMADRLDHLENVLQDREWISADRFTAADLLMADVLRVPKIRPFGDRTETAAYVARVTTRHSFKNANADPLRSEARREGEEWFRTWKSRG